MTNPELPDLPIVTGKTLTPKLLGPEAFYKLLPKLVSEIPNLDEVLARRDVERRPVPVMFEAK